MHLTEYSTLCQFLGVAVHFLIISVLTWQLCFVFSLLTLSKSNAENFIQPNPPSVVYLAVGHAIPITVTVVSYIIQNDGYGGEYFCWTKNAGVTRYFVMIPAAMMSAICLVITLVSLSNRSHLEKVYKNAYFIMESIRGATNICLAASILLPVILINGSLIEIQPNHQWLMLMVRYLFAIFNGIYGIILYTLSVHYNIEVKIGLICQEGSAAKLEAVLGEGFGARYYN